MTDILSLIDHAIEDYGTSDDAMRWTAERPAAGLLFHAPAGTLVDSFGGAEWTPLGVADPDGSTYLPATSLTTGIRYELQARGSFTMVPRSVTVSFPLARMSSGMFRLVFNRRHPRVRAMHCAYSRRLKARRRRSR